MLRTTLLIVLVLSALGRLSAQEPSPGAVLFGKKCAGCHTLGDGDRAGPDLLGVTDRRDHDWIRAFVRSPVAKISAGDAQAITLLRKFNNLTMPDNPLSDTEMSDLLAYLVDCTKKGGCKPYLGVVKHAKDSSEAERLQGRALFEGRDRLTNAGPACISCHSAGNAGLLGGGTFAMDLTSAHARLEDTGLQAALDATPFPAMRDIYTTKPLTAVETYALKSFLWDTGLQGASTAAPDRNFIYLGVIGLFAALGTIGAIWARRGTGPRPAARKSPEKRS